MQRCEDTDDDCHQVGFTPFVQCRSREGGILHTTSVSLPLWTDNSYLIFVLFLFAGYSFDFFRHEQTRVAPSSSVDSSAEE